MRIRWWQELGMRGSKRKRDYEQRGLIQKDAQPDSYGERKTVRG